MKKILFFILLCLYSISCTKEYKKPESKLELQKHHRPINPGYSFAPEDLITLPNGIIVGKQDSLYILDGDIQLSERQFQLLKTASTKSAAIQGFVNYWRHGIVYYQFSSDYLKKAETETAMNNWSRQTGIKFQPNTSSSGFSYILFKNNPDYPNVASSYIGCQGNEQTIVVGKNCSQSTITHEIGHALGLFHEHCRADRDNYVTILWNNIETNPDRRPNFNKYTLGYDIGPFDFNSLMLYDSWAFSKIQSEDYPTIIKKDGSKFIGGSYISEGDRAGVKFIYGPPYMKLVKTVADIVKDDTSYPVEEWEIYYDNDIYFYADPEFTIPISITENVRLLNYREDRQAQGDAPGGGEYVRYYTKIIPAGSSGVYLGRTASLGFYEYGNMRYFVNEQIYIDTPGI